ncbi:MAG TPA: hypothetical protein VGF67_04455 [Ktedonobacteraceae bacterium]|jgi:hypothetical protein
MRSIPEAKNWVAKTKKSGGAGLFCVPGPMEVARYLAASRSGRGAGRFPTAHVSPEISFTSRGALCGWFQPSDRDSWFALAELAIGPLNSLLEAILTTGAVRSHIDRPMHAPALLATPALKPRTRAPAGTRATRPPTQPASPPLP